MKHINPLTQADFYKTGHRIQYPANTEQVYSNLTPRSSHHAPVLKDYDGKIVWFGLQGFIRSFLIECWNENFFAKPKANVVYEYKRRLDNALGKDAVAVDHIEALHDLGYLPIAIKALPEGSRVNLRVPCLTIKNTIPEFFWLTNYLETVMSNELWKPATVATIAYEYRRLLEAYAEKTGAPRHFIDWQGHDFSCRGMSGMYDSQAAGAGHLLSFHGTDTISAIDYLEDWYHADSDKEMIGGSVPATEHSVMSMGGIDDEIGTFRRLISEVYPGGIVSIVSDTWDFFKVITEYAAELKPEILARTPDAFGNAKVVFRPDSGDPADILCGTARVLKPSSTYSLDEAAECVGDILWGEVAAETAHGECGAAEATGLFEHNDQLYKVTVEIEWNRYDKQYYYVDGWRVTSCVPHTLTPEEKGAVQCLWETFGGTTTDKGYKVLDSHVGLIYGDSITLERAQDILARLEAKGFASNNVVFGIGSFTYQYLTRDTFGWAVKATAGIVDGEYRELSKNPKTDNGVKKSAAGYLRVEKEGDDFVLYDRQTAEQAEGGALELVFVNGVLCKHSSLREIRRTLGALSD